LRKPLIPVLLLMATALWAIERQPNADYHARRTRLAQKADGAFLVFAATEPEGPNALYGFRQDDNFYYLSGWGDPGGAILIVPARPASDSTPAQAYTEVLFLPAHNPTQEKWTGPKLAADNRQAAQVTGFDRVEMLDQLRDELARLLPAGRSTLYVNKGAISDSSIQWLQRANAFPPYLSIADIAPLLASLRVVKDAGEIRLMRAASDASVAAHQAAMKAVRPGINEHDISALMQYEFQKRGCERPAYAPIVGSGPNSTVLHYSKDDRTIKDGDLVLMDVAGEYSMYASDITRTLPANGKFTSRQREIYDIVLGAQEAAIKAFQAGKSNISRDGPDSLYRIAYDYINSHGKDLHGRPLGQYFIHGLSHYVGLNVHDVGDTSIPLDKGMVFTIEPGIYIPEEDLGVRIEDIFWVDDDGRLVRLPGNLVRTAAEVETAMAAR